MTNALPPQRFVVDTHAHFYACYDVERYIDAAIRNAKRLGNAVPCLLMADRWNQDSLGEICSGLSRSDSLYSVNTSDRFAIVKRSGELAGILIQGRQLRSREGLEILAFGGSQSLPDGESFRDILRSALCRAKLAIVPWGFGKWLGKRRNLARNAIREVSQERTTNDDVTATIAIGDNACRPDSFRVVGSIRDFVEDDTLVLPGTDLLPFPSETRRVASLGLLVDLETSIHSLDDPLVIGEQLLTTVASGDGIAVGKHVTIARFIWQQAALRTSARCT